VLTQLVGQILGEDRPHLAASVDRKDATRSSETWALISIPPS